MDRSSKKRNAATAIISILQEAGFEAVFAGGCVRDMLLERESDDYDVATNALPEEIKDIFPGSDLVGESFGVVIVKSEGINTEIATYRKDGEYSDGRRPENVEFVRTKEEDAARRDFTINAMFYDPISEELFDFYGGKQDLRMRTIRFVGEPADRINEDRLRMLRAVRFASRFSFHIDRLSELAIVTNADKITEIAWERIGLEFTKAFKQCDSRGRRVFIELLYKTCLLDKLIPELIDEIGCLQSPKHHPEGDVFVHTLGVIESLPDKANTDLIWGGLLHDIGKPLTQTWDSVQNRWRFNSHDSVGANLTKKILSRMKYSNGTIEHVSNLVGSHMRFIFVKDMRKAKFKRFIAQKRFGDHLHLHRADCISSHGKLTNWEYCIKHGEELLEQGEQLGKLPDRLVNGNDLIVLGLKPGPEFKLILEEAMDMQLEGSTRESILNYIKYTYIIKPE